MGQNCCAKDTESTTENEVSRFKGLAEGNAVPMPKLSRLGNPATSSQVAADEAPVQQDTELPRAAGKLVKSRESWLRDGITYDEVSKHNSMESAWIIIKDRIYDCTPYLKDHPGGASSIITVAGEEASEDFEAIHSKIAWNMLENYFLGPLNKSVVRTSKSLDGSPKDGSFLNARQFQKLPLVKKTVVSRNTRIFRFGLPDPKMKPGLPTGNHMMLKGKWKGETVMRPYTPMTDDCTLGHVDLLIKVYFANEHPRFPDGGKMSQLLDSMQIGDTIEVKGPLGDFHYKGKGAFTWQGTPRNCTHISMIAGGTGLTPCWQVANAVMRDPDDKTRVSLLYANQTPDDILAREQLEQLQRENPKRFKLWYTVSRGPNGKTWPYSVGYVNEELIRNHLFGPGDGRIAVMCGPPNMQEQACMPNLLRYGYRKDDIFVF